MKSTLRFDASALPEASNSLPTEFRLLKFGQNKFWKVGQDKEGSLLFDADSAKSVMDGFVSKGIDSIAIDLDHGIVNGGASDSGKAYGYFVPAVRADGLYATNVKWNDEGAALLKAKSFRWFSPTVQTDDEGRVTDLLPVALTNLPSLKGIPALVAAKATAKQGNKPMKLVLSALGLAEDADEVATLAAVEKIKSDSAQLLTALGAKNIAEAIGLFTAAKTKADQATVIEAELTQLKAKQAEAEVTSMLDEAVKDGRVAPAKRSDMLALSAKYGIEALRSCLAVMGKQPAQKEVIAPPADDKKPIALSASIVKLAEVFGVKPESLVTSSARPSLPTSSDRHSQDATGVAEVFGVTAESLSARKNTFSIPVASNSDR